MTVRYGIGIVPSVLLAALLLAPATVSAGNGPSQGGGIGAGTVCGHMYDASTGATIDGAVFILEILKYDMPIFVSAYQGYYEFKKVPSGSYTLRAVCSNYEQIYRYDVQVRKGEVTVEDFTLRRAGYVTGVVREAITSHPVEGATVRLLEGTEHNYCLSRSDGAFTILHVLPGTYTLQIEKEGYATYTYPSPVVVREFSQTWLSYLYLTPE